MTTIRTLEGPLLLHLPFRWQAVHLLWRCFKEHRSIHETFEGSAEVEDLGLFWQSSVLRLSSAIKLIWHDISLGNQDMVPDNPSYSTGEHQLNPGWTDVMDELSTFIWRTDTYIGYDIVYRKQTSFKAQIRAVIIAKFWISDEYSSSIHFTCRTLLLNYAASLWSIGNKKCVSISNFFSVMHLIRKFDWRLYHMRYPAVMLFSMMFTITYLENVLEKSEFRCVSHKIIIFPWYVFCHVTPCRILVPNLWNDCLTIIIVISAIILIQTPFVPVHITHPCTISIIYFFICILLRW